MNYAEQIAQLRQQREAQDYAEQAQNIVDDYQQAVQLRDEAAQRGDADSFHTWDRDCVDLERTWARYYAPVPQQQPVDPKMAGYFHRKKTFLDRHGERAAAAMDQAHQYATRARTGSANPAQTGMGLQAGTPQYFKAMDDLLEMYAGNFGLKYDAKEDQVSPQEAARISNVRNAEYDAGVRQMYSMGRNSAAEDAVNWGRKV